MTTNREKFWEWMNSCLSKYKWRLVEDSNDGYVLIEFYVVEGDEDDN